MKRPVAARSADAPPRKTPAAATAPRLELRQPGRLTPPILAAFGATLALLLAHAWIYHFLTDDAYISFRYARNLAHGDGLVFNPGFEAVEGYSNFLWVLILAFFDKLGVPPERAANPLSLLLTFGLWGLVARAAWRRRAAFPSDVWAVVPPLLLAVLRTVAVWSTSGLETRCFEFFAVAGVLRAIDELEVVRTDRPAGVPYAAILLGLAALTRPDGVLVGGATWGVAFLLLMREDPRRAVAWLVRGLPWLALVAGHQAFRLAYYHAWAPNTYYAKVGGRTEWGQGVEYFVAFALEYAAFLWIPLAALGVVHLWRTGARSWLLLVAAAVLPHLLYVAAIGGDHFEYRPLGLGIPFAVLLAGEGLAAWAARGRAWVPAISTVVLIGASVLLPWRSHVEFPKTYSSGFPGDRASQGPEADRFLLPAGNPVTRLPLISAWAAAHRVSLLRISSHYAGLRQEEHKLFLAMVEAEAHRIRALIDRGALPRDVSIALNCVGVIPYVTDARTLDRHGLTDAHVARQPFLSEMMAHGKAASIDYGRERNIDLWFDDPALLVAPLASSRFMRAYLNVEERSTDAVALQGPGDTWLLAALPRGLDATRARLPQWRLWPLADPVARVVVRDRAIEAWRADLAKPFDASEDWDALGFLLLDAGRPNEAVEAYEHLVALRPGDSDALNNLAEARRRAGPPEPPAR